MPDYRVLWRDASGQGRFDDVESVSPEGAVWQVAMEQDGSLAEFVAIQAIAARPQEDH